MPTVFARHRHRDEISKIPMYADSILKMLKDIRRTVNASAKLQPGSNAFTQFLDEVRMCDMDVRTAYHLLLQDAAPCWATFLSILSLQVHSLDV